MADLSPADPPAPPALAARRPWLVRRWPTWLAIGVAVLMWGADVASLRELLVLLPLEYVVVAAIGARRATWPALCVCSAVFAGLTAQAYVAPVTALLALAAAVLAAGLFRRRGRGALLVQGAGMILFGGSALFAAAAAPEAARYLIAAGWFAHGVWDFAHLRADRTVSRSYAEACGVLDIVVAALLIAA